MVLVHDIPFFTVCYEPPTEDWRKKGMLGSKKQCRRSFPIDLKETEPNYYVYADLPGYNKDQIQIEFDDGERTLHILAKQSPTVDSNDGASEKSNLSETWLKRERPDLLATECERYVELPKDAVAEQASADLIDGVLKVTIPRQLPKRYAIQLI